jgi:hypothetical protein
MPQVTPQAQRAERSSNVILVRENFSSCNSINCDSLNGRFANTVSLTK